MGEGGDERVRGRKGEAPQPDFLVTPLVFYPTQL